MAIGNVYPIRCDIVKAVKPWKRSATDCSGFSAE